MVLECGAVPVDSVGTRPGSAFLQFLKESTTRYHIALRLVEISAQVTESDDCRRKDGVPVTTTVVQPWQIWSHGVTGGICPLDERLSVRGFLFIH